MTVSVIMPTRNGQQWISEQLEALSEQTFAGEWELIVADNGASDETRALVESWRDRFAAFRVLDVSEVRGQSHARNQAALEASGDTLLFTDHDDIVCRDWIALLTEALLDSPMATGPVAHFVDGVPLTADNVQEPQRRLRVGPFTPPIGCNMGTPRAVFLELGGVDETVPLGWEDIALGIRAARRGLPTAWVEDAVVLHRRPSSTRSMWRKEFGYGRGWTILERRYREVSPARWL